MHWPPELDVMLDRVPFRRTTAPVGRPRALDREGEPIVVIGRGRVLATVLDASGDELLCTLRTSGMLLGLETLAGLGVSYLLWPLVETEVWTASQDAFEAYLQTAGSPALVTRLAAQSVGVCLRERLMLARPTTVRLAQFLLEVTEAEDDGTAGVAFPRHVIARLLSMRPETLSRTLRRLEEEGALAVDARSLRVLNHGALARVASA